MTTDNRPPVMQVRITPQDGKYGVSFTGFDMLYRRDLQTELRLFLKSLLRQHQYSTQIMDNTYGDTVEIVTHETVRREEEAEQIIRALLAEANDVPEELERRAVAFVGDGS